MGSNSANTANPNSPVLMGIQTVPINDLFE